jgi:hypothetical protein
MTNNKKSQQPEPLAFEFHFSRRVHQPNPSANGGPDINAHYTGLKGSYAKSAN